MRTFSLQEAQAILPVVEGLLRKCMDGKKSIEAAETEFAKIKERIFYAGGALIDVKHFAVRRAERDKSVQRVRDAMAEIDAIGVQVKDLEIGLLDFPCKVEGEIVLLCWKVGEPSITHWHGMDEGYAGRKPIDERILRANPGEVN